MLLLLMMMMTQHMMTNSQWFWSNLPETVQREEKIQMNKKSSFSDIFGIFGKLSEQNKIQSQIFNNLSRQHNLEKTKENSEFSLKDVNSILQLKQLVNNLKRYLQVIKSF